MEKLKKPGLSVMQIIFFLFIGLGTIAYMANEDRKEEKAAREKAEKEEIRRKEREAAKEKWEAEAPMREEADKRRAEEREKRELAERLMVEKEAARQLALVLQKFDDANLLASSTPRIALAGPIQNLQQINRELQLTSVTPCLSQAKSDFYQGISYTIKRYLAFMRQEEEGSYARSADGFIKSGIQQTKFCISK